MKKPRFPILILATLLVCAFTLGFLLGRNRNHGAVRLSVPASMLTEPPQTTAPAVPAGFPIDLNTAGKEELMALPGIGEVLAQRILDYRDKIGLFRSVEELCYVEGIGQKRLDEIYDLITIGG